MVVECYVLISPTTPLPLACLTNVAVIQPRTPLPERPGTQVGPRSIASRLVRSDLSGMARDHLDRHPESIHAPRGTICSVVRQDSMKDQ